MQVPELLIGLDTMDVEIVKKKQKFLGIKNFQATLENLFSKANDNLIKEAVVIEIGGANTSHVNDDDNLVYLESTDQHSISEQLLIEEEEEREIISIELDEAATRRDQPTEASFHSKTFENITDLEKKVVGYIEEVAGAGWKCRKCQVIFFQEEHLREHIDGHLRDHSFKCQRCKNIFGNRKAFAAHDCFSEEGTTINQGDAMSVEDMEIMKPTNENRAFVSNNMVPNGNTSDIAVEENIVSLQCERCKNIFGNRDTFDAHDCFSKEISTIAKDSPMNGDDV